MMPNIDDNISFPHLNESNYHEWAMRMEAQLILLDLWDTVVYEPPTNPKGGAEEAWIKNRAPKKMARARAEIILRVEPSQLSDMQSRDPMEIWKNLARIHVARGVALGIPLLLQFNGMAKGPNEPMVAWIGRVKAFAFRLTSSGVEVPDINQMTVLLNGLDASYAVFVDSISALATDQLTLENFVNSLLIQDILHSERKERERNVRRVTNRTKA